jgi:4-oxalomesaconate tautomerase
VLTLNTGMQCDITVLTPLLPDAAGRRYVEYAGAARIDGAPGCAAPIAINFLDTAGSVAPGLLPTGRVRDVIDGLDVSCIDNGMPLVLLKASAVGRTGYESVAELNADSELRARLERLRIACGHAMQLGDVSAKNYPKMTLIAPPRQGGTLCTRSFIPHVCHDAIGVLAAVTVGTACVLPGSVCEGVAVLPAGSRQSLSEGVPQSVSVEHPSGEFSVELELDPAQPQQVRRAALLRTARLLMRGQALIPRAVWAGHPDLRGQAG